MIIAMIRELLRALLSLRYRVRVRGLDDVAARGTRGILFLANHPGLIDPFLVTLQLHRRFAPGALADRDQIDRPIVRWLARNANVSPLPDIARYGPQARKEVESVISRCAERLRGGGNMLLYPSGHIYRSRYEDLRGNSSVETILRAAPQTRIVIIRTRGVWGSSFSLAGGRWPDLGAELRRDAFRVLSNFIFFGPRRKVSIELLEPADLPLRAGRDALNAYLQRVYNEDAPPALYVPYTIWERGGTHEMPEPTFERMAGDSAAVPAATRQIVMQYLSQVSGISGPRDNQRLAEDLGLDSLAKSELLVWLGREFGATPGDVAALQTVGDVLLATRGESAAARPVELKPVSPVWFKGGGAVRLEIPDCANLADGLLQQARRDPSRAILADQIRGVMTYRDLITAILVLKPHLECLAGDHVAIMLPASVVAGVVYLAALFARKIPVMVNWTTGARNIAHSLELTGARHVLTAGPLVARIESGGTDLSALRDRLLLLESLGAQISRTAKLAAALRARLDWSALETRDLPETAAILLTSGSEALPKAVPLTHANILTNARDVARCYELRADDSMIGFLPPFHSFGLTVTLLLPLLAGLRVVFHSNPTEPWVLARLIEAYRATLICGTPTFLGGIARAAGPGQLDTLRLAVTGAEACPPRVYEALAQRCPRAIVCEGYGVTECSPIVAANRAEDARAGTIGRPLPSVEIAIVHPESGRRAASGETGVLLVRGPSVFPGYLGDAPSPFVEFEGGPWYRTGDLVSADEAGILTFRGRLKRFVKIGGEMISLPAIESVLERGYATEGDEGPVVAIEATPNEAHPEVVLFTTLEIDRADANRRIREASLSALHNVSRVIRVDSIPLLGTGKTDYRSLRETLRSG
ncbi:MAG: acyl-[ACP]--phospholipid O-acyltransferase [Phycisphaerae bacterium]